MNPKKSLLFLFVVLMLGAPRLPAANAPKSTVPAKKTAPDKSTLQKLEENLKKIEASIDVTKQRIQVQKDTQFAPDLYFMLAELMHDRASAAATLKKEKNKGVPEGEIDFNQEKRFSQEAVEMYKVIEDRYTDYASMDRVLYTIATEYRALGSEKEALAYFKKVAERYPKSTYASKSLVDIGDIFMSHKDYEYALGQFKKAEETAKEPELSSARYKMGMCYVQLDKWVDSLSSFEKVFSPEKNPSPETREDMREDALVASVWPLLELSPHETLNQPLYQKPIEYYRKTAGDKARFRRVLARLAARLELKKRPQEAAEAALELFRLSDVLNEKKAAFETAYTQLKKNKSGEFPMWLPAEIRNLLLKMKDPAADRKVQADFPKYEAAFRDVLTSINKNAVLTKRQEDLILVGEGYQDYVLLYPKGKFTLAMKLNQAEAFFQAGEKARAGQTYFEVVQAAKGTTAAKKKGVLDSALESFLNVISDSKADLLSKVQARDGYREVAKTYQSSFRGDSKLPDIRFNVAKTYYDEQSYDQAAKDLLAFIRSNPSHAQAKPAALLYMDCFYLRGQMKEMATAGKTLLAIGGLSNDTKTAVRQASTQAQMKAIRSVAGDFTSKDYAMKFREFARKNKNSSVGEQALYEAFTSMKSQNQPQAFEVGEEYVGTYEKTPRGKEVLLSLSQMALVLMDHQRAASYMAAFAQKYPQDANAKAFASQAALIYEFLGDMRESVTAYQMAGDNNGALKALLKFGDWKQLNQVASSVPGLAGQYYQGLSMIRQGNEAAAMSLLQRVAESSGSSSDEKEMVGHAAILMAEKNLAKFRNESKGQPFSAPLLQAKAAQYQSISNLLNTAVNSGGGRWVIGGLYNLYLLNLSFADFLRNAQPPAGMQPAQLQQMVAPQVASYMKTAQTNRDLCVKTAHDNEIPSNFVNACRKGVVISEASEFSPWARASRGPASSLGALGAELKANPRSAPILRKIAAAEIQNGQPSRALLVLSRASEVAPGESLNETYTGIAYLSLKQYGYAQASFQAAIAKNPQDGLAYRGLAGIAQNFGFEDKAKVYSAKAGSNRSPLHPWMQ